MGNWIPFGRDRTQFIPATSDLIGFDNLAALDDKDMAELRMIAGNKFSSDELHKLYKTFLRADQDKNGVLDIAEFTSLEPLVLNPLAERIFQAFDEKNKDALNFRDFVRGLSIMHPKGNREDKLRLNFRLYDVDGDGSISKQDIEEALFRIGGEGLSQNERWDITDAVFQELGAEGEGVISYETFAQALSETDFESKMVLNMLD